MTIFQKIVHVIKKFNTLEISWQIYSLVILYVLIMFFSFFINKFIGLILLVFLIVIIIFLILNTKNFIRDLNVIATQLTHSATTASQDSLYRAPIGILIYDENHRVRWVNSTFQNLYERKDLIGEKLININQEFEEIIELPDNKEWHLYNWDNNYYRVMHRQEINSIYFFDVTEEIDILESKKYNQLVFGYLFLDDYNEVSESMSDEQSAKFDSELLKDINQWANSYGIYTKRIDEEKFILLMNLKTLDALEESKFTFFNDLHEKNYAKNVPISISIGLAYPDTDDYTIKELESFAQSNLDLALGRGGNQIVVRSQNNRARFYGGKSNPAEKRSNVRARLVYQALKTQIEEAENVLITGHKIPDTDSIGSAIGIQKIAAYTGKDAKIIVNPEDFNHDIKGLLNLPEAPNWDGILIGHDQIPSYLKEQTLIIMVDHSRPTLSEAEEYLEGHDVVVIDHHRRSEEFPEDVVLSYIEVYASSASELVTEFFMNMRNTAKTLNKYEATALLAGIIVDTNNFSNRTGSRTFDSASYLRSRGADLTQVHSILKEDYDSVIQRNKLLETANFVYEDYAIAMGKDDVIIDNIVAAQAADALLEIIGVEASFVIYRRSEDTIGISGRSLNKINVQAIMEQLGGGGHFSNAATQKKGITIDEAYTKLVAEIAKTQGD